MKITVKVVVAIFCAFIFLVPIAAIVQSFVAYAQAKHDFEKQQREHTIFMQQAVKKYNEQRARELWIQQELKKRNFPDVDPLKQHYK